MNAPGPPAPTAWWRYLIPNAVTSASLLFGAIAVQAAVDGRPVAAAWWGLLVVLTDKADGFLASALKGGSAFGVQLDSLADLVAFGVVPATVLYSFYRAHPQLGWSSELGRFGLRALCALYVVVCGLRLARFNVGVVKGPVRHYFGVPSTVASGLLMALFLACLKYADPSWSAPEVADAWRPLGGLRSDALLPWLPLLLPLCGLGMLSTFRVPKLGRTFSRATDVVLIVCVALSYATGLSRRLPEYLAAAALFYLGVSVAYHLRTQRRGV